jgi:hypothetical protein
MRDVGLVPKNQKHGHGNSGSRDCGSLRNAGGSSRGNSSGNLRGTKDAGNLNGEQRTNSKDSSGNLRGTPHNATAKEQPGPPGSIQRQDSGRLRAMDRINPNADATSKSGSTENKIPSSQNSKSGGKPSGTHSNANSRDNSRDNVYQFASGN